MISPINIIRTLPVLLLVSCTSVTLPATDRLQELDAYWKEVSRCVGEGDFKGYSATCHEEGVLVAGTSNKAYSLNKALSNWEKNFINTKSGKMPAGVEFRLSKRLGDESTAHETGMFLYWEVKEGKRINEYIHLEALLIKKNGRWLMLMEYQKSKGTKAEWDALK
jgi:hypothetical protein